MTDDWIRCPDCQDMIKRFGRDNLEVCEICMHLYNDKIFCACDQYSRDGADNDEKEENILEDSRIL